VIENPVNKLLGWLKNLNPDTPQRTARRLQPIVDLVNRNEESMQSLSDDQMAKLTLQFRERIQSGSSLDDLLPEAFAAVREATVRTIGDRQFDVQVMGGIILHKGSVAEMKTGEGKTYCAPLAAYLNALSGQGVHVVTVNDYLARRDRDWMGPVLESLGLSVGVIQAGMSADDRRAAYLCDVTYGTNNEFGFDYLRDNMVHDLSARVQRQLNFAIVDEIDNILIDEARTPLIISGQAEESAQHYYEFARLVRNFEEGAEYTVDLKARAISMTDDGIDRVEQRLNIDNIYAEGNFQMLHYLQQAIKAKSLYHRGKEYVLVRDGVVIDGKDPNAEIAIVDEFTGRLMPGRRFGEGLHQSIEAKERVQVQAETQTLATVTYQNFFRTYIKLAGMTGTAKTEEEELQKIYGLDVQVVPTHQPMIRQDHSDYIYRTIEAKYEAVATYIRETHSSGRPVLVGTTSIESSERLSEMLKVRKIGHQVLNAKYHEQEASIVENAGQLGSVTIATNMAGRGTDIKLGSGVAELGGLSVIGTERHESRRIDNQLRGRSGRQGDPGESRFFISLEDELMRRFRSDRIAGIMEKLGMDDSVPIENKIVSRSIESAQSRVEAYNFDIRKHVVEFDDVVNRQREIIYRQREEYLEGENLRGVLEEMLDQEVHNLVINRDLDLHSSDEDLLAGVTSFNELTHNEELELEDLLDCESEEIINDLCQRARRLIDQRSEDFGDYLDDLLRWLLLQQLDFLWVGHLTAVEELRQGIGLVAYGQQNPLVEFKRQGFRLFRQLQDVMRYEVTRRFFRLEARPVTETETILTAQAGLEKRGGVQGHTLDDRISSQSTTGSASDQGLNRAQRRRKAKLSKRSRA